MYLRGRARGRARRNGRRGRLARRAALAADVRRTLVGGALTLQRLARGHLEVVVVVLDVKGRFGTVKKIWQKNLQRQKNLL